VRWHFALLDILFDVFGHVGHPELSACEFGVRYCPGVRDWTIVVSPYYFEDYLVIIWNEDFVPFPNDALGSLLQSCPLLGISNVF